MNGGFRTFVSQPALPLTVDLNQVHLTDEHCAVGL
jgi:hypothetical protein